MRANDAQNANMPNFSTLRVPFAATPWIVTFAVGFFLVFGGALDASKGSPGKLIITFLGLGVCAWAFLQCLPFFGCMRVDVNGLVIQGMFRRRVHSWADLVGFQTLLTENERRIEYKFSLAYSGSRPDKRYHFKLFCLPASIQLFDKDLVIVWYDQAMHCRYLFDKDQLIEGIDDIKRQGHALLAQDPNVTCEPESKKNFAISICAIPMATHFAFQPASARKSKSMKAFKIRNQKLPTSGDANTARTTAAPVKRRGLLFNPRGGWLAWRQVAMILGLVTMSAAAGQGSQEKSEKDDTQSPDQEVLAEPGLFPQLTEPPCSYCVNQDRKGLLTPTDPVIAWIRGAHNGGAAPIKHFLTVPRVINDTYGLFFYDADGQYVTVFEKDYGYEFYGWRGGVMVVSGRDGSLWSALSGRAIAGPQTGKRLNRVPSLVTQWGHWLLLHPESTAYDLFDGKKYPTSDLPTEISEPARQSMGQVDRKLSAESLIMGVEGVKESLAVSLDGLGERACFRDAVDGRDVAVLWYGPTQTAVAFYAELDGKPLTLYADKISPETAPFKDRETGSRWTLAGRAVDGPLRGKELTWAPSVQCRWYAWSHEYPQTRLHEDSESDTRVDNQ